MCVTRPARDIITAHIRGCGGVPVLLDRVGVVRGESVPILTAAIVIGLDHPDCEGAMDAAGAARVPIVACTFAETDHYPRGLSKLPAADYLVCPDAQTLCRVLLSAIGRSESQT